MDGNLKSSELLRQFQAALKRPRPPGGASQPNIIRPKYFVVAETKARAMNNSQDSQTSLDQSENHSLSFRGITSFVGHNEGSIMLFVDDLEYISSHFGSLALTELQCLRSNVPDVENDPTKQRDIDNYMVQ
ncbi:hypothetical protein KIW84_030805 [Lathyrus oleraceus]|uniref:Uncharacterized protein n=1 Tax=Pisum sativum TaxID=3888 RepID=A0A9D4XP56_PEA|nr:hypothetical protein KIW84_030805 [Pisum sativum]